MTFWNDKSVFMTGHTGFKGSWLALWLQALGARVTGFALEPPTVPSMFAAARVEDGMTSVIGDIRDAGTLRDALVAAQPEIVFHMAAMPLVLESYREPVATYATNVMGTVHLLEAVRACPSVKVVVVVTSDKCYDNRGWVWGYREDEPMGGSDPYSNSKGCTELVASSYRRSFFGGGPDHHPARLTTVRAGNVIGGGDWAEYRLIPDTVRAVVAGQPVMIRRPNAIRPWQHVLEPLSGYMRIAERLWENGETHRAWNFGPSADSEQPVVEVVGTLCRLWGPPAEWKLDGATYGHEENYLKLDSSRARTELGWSPRWSLEDALTRTVEWYRAFYDGDRDMRALTLSQIDAYRG